MIKGLLKIIKGKADVIFFWIKIGFVAAFLGLAFFAYLTAMERDQAIQDRDDAKSELKATRMLLDAQIDALEQAREEDASRFEFTKNTEKDIAAVRDERPLSAGQRLVAERVRDRYRQKFAAGDSGRTSPVQPADDHRASGDSNAR